MNDTDTQSLNLKTILLLVVVAIVAATLVTLAQTLIMGKANVAITGGVVVPIIVAIAMTARRKRVS